MSGRLASCDFLFGISSFFGRVESKTNRHTEIDFYHYLFSRSFYKNSIEYLSLAFTCTKEERRISKKKHHPSHIDYDDDDDDLKYEKCVSFSHLTIYYRCRCCFFFSSHFIVVVVACFFFFLSRCIVPACMFFCHVSIYTSHEIRLIVSK